MSSLTKRNAVRGGPRRALVALLRVYLAATLGGCASTRPAPTVEEARRIGTRTLDANYDRAYSAVLAGLQDLSFTIETSDRGEGLVVASRESRRELAEIFRHPDPDREEGMPVGAKGALVATGAIVVVGLIAILSDDDEDDRDRDHGCREHDHVSTVYVHDDGPDGPEIFRYEITMSLRPLGRAETEIRFSGYGTRSRNGVVEEAGPIHDPRFFDEITGRVSDSLTRPYAGRRPVDRWESAGIRHGD